jgi:tryptophan-rich sensory protein
MTLARSWLPPVLIAFVAAFGVAALGGSMTDLGPWYRGLAKPAWNPPDWLFPIAWTLIFALAALSAALAWHREPDRRRAEWLVGLYALNGFLNVAWSLLFFRLQRPDWALADVVLLWLSILWIMLSVRRVSPVSAWLLVPYIAWVTAAALLNRDIVRLNGPFG